MYKKIVLDCDQNWLYCIALPRGHTSDTSTVENIMYAVVFRNSNLEYLIIWLSTIWLYPICQEIPAPFSSSSDSVFRLFRHSGLCGLSRELKHNSIKLFPSPTGDHEYHQGMVNNITSARILHKRIKISLIYLSGYHKDRKWFNI